MSSSRLSISCTVLAAGWLSTAAAAGAAWPVTGSREVLHSFGTPFHSGATQFHKGVDILGSGLGVVAVRGGTVTVVTPDEEGCTGEVIIRSTIDGATVTDRYLHVAPLQFGFAATVAAGTKIGTITTNCNDPQHGHGIYQHLHWEIWTSSTAQTFENPLEILTGGDRDPKQEAVAVDDADGVPGALRARGHDPSDSSSGSATGPNGVVVWGDVDLIVEAFDDMSPSRDMDVAPYQLTYWIEALQAGSDVASEASPYQVFCFDAGTLGSAALGVVCRDGGCAELDQPSGTRWPRFLSWQVTAATERRPISGPCGSWLPANGYWRTKAQATSAASGACKPNGIGCGTASSNGTARFRDGRYRLHIETADLSLAHDATPWSQDLVVDNWAPWVARVVAGPAENAADETLFYEAVFTASSAAIEPRRPSTATWASLVRRLASRSSVRLEVEFSEPVSMPSLAFGGVELPTPTASRTVRGRAVWVWQVDAAVRLGTPLEARISAVDLAGNPLVPITTRRRPPTSSHRPARARPVVIAF